MIGRSRIEIRHKGPRPAPGSLISERTRAGVKAAQRRGVKFGRKVKLTPERINHARKLIEKGEGRQYVADLLSVGRSTLYRALATREELSKKR